MLTIEMLLLFELPAPLRLILLAQLHLRIVSVEIPQHDAKAGVHDLWTDLIGEVEISLLCKHSSLPRVPTLSLTLSSTLSLRV